MSRMYDTIEPSVINEEMLSAAVEEQGPKNEARSIARQEGINFEDVISLRLDYKNILKIDNLWCFRNLVKLQLDNNIIEKIEGLDVLVNLAWLDLSFNNIEVIEGMDKLTKLEDLTLFNNRIQRLENMDSFSELHVFSIGNNNLKDLDNVTYLRRFQKLQTVNFTGNPICELGDYKMFIVAYLPQLVYLDYRLVDKSSRAVAYEKYEISIQEFQQEEKISQTKLDKQLADQEEFNLHKAAYVENLNGCQLFDAMYADDTEGQKLNGIPGFEETVAAYKENFTSVCRGMFEFGLTRHEERQKEIASFLDCIEEAKLENKRLAAVKIDEFLDFKQKVWQDLLSSSDQVAVEIMISDYHLKVGDLWDALMGLEMQLVDQLEDAIKEYERSMSEMVAGFLEYMQGQMSQCRELENIHHERLLEAAVALLEKQMKNELDDQISDDLRDLLIDKDTVVNAVTTSHDAHLLKIDNREDDMNTFIRQWFATLMDEIHDREEVKRNRFRVTEINHLIDHLRDDIENLDLMINA